MAEAALQAEAEGRFPASLEQVPHQERIGEAFGYTPGLFAAVFFAVGVAVLMPSTRGDRNAQLMTGAASVLIGFALAALEVWRRQNRTTLVLREGALAIYRKQKLALVADLGHVVRYDLHWMNTFRYLFIPALLAPGMAFVALDPNSKAGDRPLIGALALGIFVMLASLVRTRILLKHFLLPKGKRTEEVMLTRDDVARLYAPR